MNEFEIFKNKQWINECESIYEGLIRFELDDWCLMTVIVAGSDGEGDFAVGRVRIVAILGGDGGHRLPPIVEFRHRNASAQRRKHRHLVVFIRHQYPAQKKQKQTKKNSNFNINFIKWSNQVLTWLAGRHCGCLRRRSRTCSCPRPRRWACTTPAPPCPGDPSPRWLPFHHRSKISPKVKHQASVIDQNDNLKLEFVIDPDFKDQRSMNWQ